MVQDALLGVYLFTMRDTFLTLRHMEDFFLELMLETIQNLILNGA